MPRLTSDSSESLCSAISWAYRGLPCDDRNDRNADARPAGSAGSTVLPCLSGGAKQPALVALLLLNANDVVPLRRADRRAVGWASRRRRPRRTSRTACRGSRKRIGTRTRWRRAPRAIGCVVDPEAIDARRFERLVREARPLPARERAAALRDALELWRGTPLSDLAYWSFAQDAIRNLQEQRVNALQMRHRGGAGAGASPGGDRWARRSRPAASDPRAAALAADARVAPLRPSTWTRLRPTRRCVWRSSRSRAWSRGRSCGRCSGGCLQDDPTLMPRGVAEDEIERPAQLARKVVAVCIVELLVDEELDVEAARGLVSRGLGVAFGDRAAPRWPGRAAARGGGARGVRAAGGARGRRSPCAAVGDGAPRRARVPSDASRGGDGRGARRRGRARPLGWGADDQRGG